MPDKIVLKHDEQEIEFPLDAIIEALPDGLKVFSPDDLEEAFVAKDIVKSEYVPKPEFKRRLKSAVDNAHEDEKVIARVLDTHKGDIPDKDALFKQWEAAYKAPLEQEIAEYKDMAKGASLREAASKYFREEFVTPLADGSPSYVEVALGKQFANDGLEVYAVDSSGDPLLPLDTRSGRTRRTVEEHLSVLAEDPSLKAWLKEPPKGGGGSGRPGDADPPGEKNFSQMSDEELAAAYRAGEITTEELLKL